MSDYTAMVVFEKQHTQSHQPEYHARHIMRFALGTSYPTMVEQVCLIYKHPSLREHTRTLVIDATGCGRPVADMLKPCAPIAISLHGGENVHHEGRNWQVPKRDVVAAAQVLLQQRRLKLASSLPLTPVLEQELLNFRLKIDATTAHDSYAAWREGQHDDLVLAAALACWWGEHGPKPGRVVLMDLPPPRPWWW
jgi:hypothetical protein